MSTQPGSVKQDVCSPFVWRPGVGPNADGIQRMRDHFLRPAEPMGEAWFMGDERVMFEVLLGDLDLLSLEELRTPLWEIASGNASFGPMQEWTTWFHYLLSRLIHRHSEQSFDSLYQNLVTAFIAVYPRRIEEPYPGFADDARQTLGRCLMDPSRWMGERLAVVAPEAPSPGNRDAAFEWRVACGDFSAGMFFCAKYLEEAELEAWLDSVFAIGCPLWTTQLYSWLSAVHPLLVGEVVALGDIESDRSANVVWLGAEVLRGDFTGVYAQEPVSIPTLSTTRCDLILAGVRKHVSNERYRAWLEAMKPHSYLEAMLSDTSMRLAEAFDIN